MAYDFRKVKVLVVDCSQPMLELIKNVLGVFTVPVKNIHSAFNCDEAFNKFSNTNHDMVIMDWLQSPEHSVRLTKLIRTDQKSPNQFVPIIMTAGSGHEKRVFMARDAGISEYLVKPFSAGSLADRITRVIENPRQFVICDAYIGPDRRAPSRKSTYTGPERRTTASSSEIDALFKDGKAS